MRKFLTLCGMLVAATLQGAAISGHGLIQQPWGPPQTNSQTSVAESRYIKGTTSGQAEHLVTITPGNTNYYPLARRDTNQIFVDYLTTNYYRLDSSLTNFVQVYTLDFLPRTATDSQFIAAQQSMYPRPVMVFNTAMKDAIDRKVINITAVGDSITYGAATPYAAGWFENLVSAASHPAS